MKPRRITRRQFFMLSAFSAVAVAGEINKVWAPHGDGIDAAVLAGITGKTLYVFRGPN